ncbi:hypothetical protein [Parasediminibacterium sp. JCM 36343]|uniref:hypothetical protein n=1 Tax=Parasediminibacterium sp. JCM 36343 TaxID=3374279 RepID=UPI00397B4332
MKYCSILFFSLLFIMGCKKQTESLVLDDIKELYPLQVGKVFIYRMDSSRKVDFIFTTAYYLLKDSVVNSFLDNQGRTSYTIFRYITDTLARQPYQYIETNYITFDKDKIEYVDGSNRRFIKLVNPVSLNTSWKGNRYFDTDSVLSIIIPGTTYYTNWDYQYISVNQPYTVLKGNFASTYTIQQVADSNTAIPSKSYSTEVYAKGVGLIYKEMLFYFYQSPTNSGDGSFGLKLNLIDYR